MLPFQLLNDTTGLFRALVFDTRLEWFRVELNHQLTIRFLVASTAGFGHQSSSVFLMRRLTGAPDGPWEGFGYQGLIEVYYEDLDEKDPTLAKLFQLLPELQGKTVGKLDQAMVQLIDILETPPENYVKWGFSGGYDLVKDNCNKDIKVYNFLVTQPFKYSIKSIYDLQNQFRPGNLFKIYDPKTNSLRWLNFDTYAGTRDFKVTERAYKLYVNDLTPQDWTYYTTSTDFPPEVQALNVALQILTSDQTLAKIALDPLYGVNYLHGVEYEAASVFAYPPNERFVLSMAAARTALNVSEKVIKPPVVLGFGRYMAGADLNLGFVATKRLLLGCPTPAEEEKHAAASNAHATAKERQQWQAAHQILLARQRSLLVAPEADLNAQYLLVDYLQDEIPVAELIRWVTSLPKRVLFVQLSFVPPPVFNYVMKRSGALPAIFEGNNTANTAVSTGNPYFNSNRLSQIGTLIRYPVGYLGTENVSVPVNQLQQVADLMQSSLDQWPLNGLGPTEILASAISQLQFPENNYNLYFQSIHNYYQRKINDKFNVAAALAIPFVYSPILTTATIGTAVLQELYDTLSALIDQSGEVNLLHDVFTSGGIFDFYTALTKPYGGALILRPAKVEKVNDPTSGELVEVKLTGPTQAFGVETPSVFHFTAPIDSIMSDATFTYELPWGLEDVPWIVLEQPGVRVIAATDAVPPSSYIIGRVKGTDIELSLAFPVTDDRILLHGEFDTPKTISDFFAIVGGVDLAAYLPPPVLALAGIGVRFLEMAINIETVAVDYVSVKLQTTTPWNFFDRLLLEDLTTTVTVVDPANLKTRTARAAITGILRVGVTKDAPRIEVGADLPKFSLRGQLADPALPLDDVLQIFWPGAHPSWPKGKVPTITQFNFAYTLESGDYNVALQLDLNWPITIAGRDVLLIQAVGMTLARAGGSTTGTLVGSFLLLPETAKIGLTIAAGYLGNNQGWRFQAQQTSGVFSISELLSKYLQWTTTLEIGIDGLNLVVETQTSSFEFGAKTAGAWQIPIDTGIAIIGKARIGYNGGVTSLGAELVAVTASKGWFGELSAEIKWRGIDLTIFYNFDPTYSSYGIRWRALTAKLEEKIIEGKKHTLATLQFTAATTLGDIVESMISWATGSSFSLGAPWNILEKIPLSGLSLSYDFTAGKVAFNVDIGPIEMGFARIDGISVTYNSDQPKPEDNGVLVTIRGSFRWQDDQSKPLGWDATKPETTPAPPGNGNKYLDLRMLAMGQHVTVPGLTEAKTVQKAIELMEKLPDPKPGEIPPVVFDSESSWLVGADFGVLKFGDQPSSSRRSIPALVAPTPPKTGYVLTMQVVFNDPYLYGLRIALAGDAAKIFKGLDFQIMYRQVSATVGVYQAEITLPDIMRHLSIGAYSITLPVFGIAIYTNGDFQVDVGFPWNEDFSRSFTIEGIVYPGIPVLGSAGFYFGKLSSASTDRVPRITNGTFNPVLVFGFGMQIGFGKSLEYGLLKAGFSITAVGIIEGVLGKFNPYLTDGAEGPSTQLQGSYYFWLRGTFGIIGRLYGSVDFAIIKADVNVTVKILLQLTYEAYVSITMTVLVSVDVSVSVKIDLGLFTIKISFSFSMRLKETFTIENAGTPPWITTGAKTPLSFHRAPAERRLRHLRVVTATYVQAAGSPDRWKRLLAPSTGTQSMAGYLAPALTVAHDERDMTEDYRKQIPCYVLLPVVDTVAETDGPVHEVVAATLAAEGDTSFERLAKMTLRWAVAAGQENDLTPDQVDDLVVKEVDLAYMLEQILVSTSGQPVPIAPDDVDTFLRRQFVLTLSAPPQGTAGSAAATYFPMPPQLHLDVPAYGNGYPGYQYQFSDYNALDDATLERLRSYFDQLAVQVQREMQAPQPRKRAAAAPLAMATWVQSDYFLLLTRQMVQAALDALRDFKFVIDGMTAQQIIETVNTTGNLPDGDDRVTLAKLFAANPAHRLVAGSDIIIGVTYVVSPTDSFQAVADTFHSEITATALAAANGANSTLLAPGVAIEYHGAIYKVQAGDSLIAVARHFQATFGDFLASATGLMTQRLFQDKAAMVIPFVGYQAQGDSTFESIAALPVYHGRFDAKKLATQNAGRAILRLGVRVTYGVVAPYAVQANDTLADVAARFGVTLAQLLEDGSVLRQPRLLADVAVVTIPPFLDKVGEQQTLTALAARFAVQLETLGLQPANGAARFADVDAEGAPAPFIDVPHLAQYRVKELIDETQRSLAIRQLSRMVARYYMHGLRLPTTGIKPLAKGIWVEGNASNYTLPVIAGLYALTGQEFPLPTIDPQTKFTFKLSRSAGPDWLRFGSGADELPITVEPDDALRIAKVIAEAQKGPFAIDLLTLGADPMYESHLASYPLTTVMPWQTPTSVQLPYGPAPDTDRVPSLRIWELPDALINLPDPRTPGKIDPRFALRVATYDEATGGSRITDVLRYGWATTITFTIKLLPPLEGSPARLTSYEIVGASGNDLVLLERMVDEVGGNDAFFDRLILGYAPVQTGGATQGVQTDPPAGVTMGIAQVNLSTETRPRSMLEALARAQGAQPIGLLNRTSDFVRLLWEASITGAGGFYLYYFDAGGGAGLPARIFNDRGEANVTLIVLQAKGATVAQSNRLTDFTNAAVTDENIDAAHAVIFAEAAPMDDPVPTATDLSLAMVTERTFSNLGDLATKNATLTLGPGASLTVTEAVFQAPPGGIALQEIVRRFGLTGVPELNAANPQWPHGLPDPLQFPTAIFLPPMTLIAGTSVHTASLSDVSTYYGQNLTSLAAHNATVNGIFALHQNIAVTGGPRLRNATVVAGVEAVMARRTVPPVPPPPSDPGFARAFLLNNFSLLNYQVSENVFFRASNVGLPAGPTAPAAAIPSQDKIQTPPTLVEGDEWEYRQAFPFPKFARTSPSVLKGLPEPSGNPYVGLGDILQVDFTWQDYFGNTIVTTLAAPQTGSSGPHNEPPMVTGYVDALIALSQWPSVASAWQVVAGSPPQIAVLLTFDPTRYSGMIEAHATGVSTIAAVFTNSLDSASANDPGNYRLLDGPAIISATLGADERTVMLTTASSLGDMLYTLAVTNVQAKSSGSQPRPAYSGTATFVVPDDPTRRASSLRENAAKDLAVYSQLYYQLTDANGIAWLVRSSLLVGVDGPGAVQLTPAQVAAVLDWLFHGSGATTSIFAFIQDRKNGKTVVALPPPATTINVDLPLQVRATAQIYELFVELEIRRIGGTVLGDLETTPGIRAAKVAIAPLVRGLEPTGGETLGLTKFANDFEAALSTNGYLMKVATGVDRAIASSVQDAATLWAVQVGIDGVNQPISYQIQNSGNPAIFAPQPISNQLQSRPQIPIYDYTTGKGISSTVSRYVDFSDIDMDTWGRQLFAMIDQTLTPAFTAPIQIVSARSASAGSPIDYLQQILDQKKLFAVSAAKWMIPVYAGESSDATAVREAFYQQLLSRLSNAYTTRAAIQFEAKVNATIHEPIATVTPRLFGNILNTVPGQETGSEITLTSPKLPLAVAANAPLAFLLMAPDQVTTDGAVVAAIQLDLTYDVTHIEHQIGELRGIKDYLASSWLSFVVPGETRPLTRGLGTFLVPMVLRAFPTSPTMTAQGGRPAKSGGTLADLTQWTYSFTYSLPFHYPQDRVHATVEFNIKDAGMALGSFLDAFPEIAEFISVFPAVSADLVGILQKIDATTDDPTQIRNAAIAVQSFIELMARITRVLEGNALLVAPKPRRLTGTADLTYTFFVEEGSVELDDPKNPTRKVRALLVSVVGQPPPGVGTPQVLIEPATYQATPYNEGECDGKTRFCYTYFDPIVGEYLSAADGQKIAERSVVLPAMDILQRQDAWATVFLKRNELLVKDRPSAEPFVYRTPDVQFANPLHPTLDWTDPINIAAIGSSHPVTRPLADQLTNLFDALFANFPTDPAANDRVTIQAEVTYDYSLADALPPIGLSVFMQGGRPIIIPPKPGIPDEDALTLAEMIRSWDAAIQKWLATKTPSNAAGVLRFDLSFLSNLSRQPMPLLRLRDLYLPLKWIGTALPIQL